MIFRLGKGEVMANDILGFNTRNRNAVVIVLSDGDVLAREGSYFHVSDGEITVYADGTVDETNGELAEIAIEGVQAAMGAHKQVFNLEDIA
jgi:hypothetical protein